MKKSAKLIILIISAILILFSCDGSITILSGDEDNHVNLNLLPYLNFTVNEDGTVTANAAVTEGAALSHVEIPGEVVINGTTYQVAKFTGFSNPEDATAIKHLIVDINIKIPTEVHNSMVNLEKITYKNTLRPEEPMYWPELPDLPNTATEHFIGWFVDGVKVVPGSEMDPNNTVATPVFQDHDHTGDWQIDDPTSHYRICSICNDHIDITPHSFTEWTQDEERAGIETRDCTVCHRPEERYHAHTLQYTLRVEPTCTEVGNVEYWHCESCDRYFLDADATSDSETTLEKTVIAALGHSLETIPDRYYADNSEHWYPCERCGTRLHLDDEGNIREGGVAHTLEFTYDYSSTTNILDISSKCKVCGHETTGQTSSSTGMFDIVTTQGMTATRVDNGWYLAVAESYEGRYTRCRWTDSNGESVAVDLSNGIENTTSSMTVASEKIDDGLLIMCHLYNGDKEVDIVFVEIHK